MIVRCCVKSKKLKPDLSVEQSKGWRYLNEREIDNILAECSDVSMSASKRFTDKAELTSIVNSLRLRGAMLKRQGTSKEKQMQVRKTLFVFSTRLTFLLDDLSGISSESLSMPPQLGECILLLVLSKDERINIPGDLAEEYIGIAKKHGKRFAKIWYYKQVMASAWPIIWKALRWGVWVSIGAWIRKLI